MSGVPVQAIVLEIVDEIDWCMGPNAKCTDLPFGGLMVLLSKKSTWSPFSLTSKPQALPLTVKAQVALDSGSVDR